MTKVASALSASQAGLLVCPCCGLVCRPAVRIGAWACPRCGTALASRKTDSLSRTWAFLIAAMLLYIPANLLPVMETASLFGAEEDTILSGVVYFWTSGSQGLATLIFVVSILVPLLKMGTLLVLAVSVHLRSSHSVHQRALLFRIVEAVGRWSMLDIFVVALMVGLVQFRTLAVIHAGPGAAAFGSVVVLTMLAARSFDPRLIWDCIKDDHD
ncbi:paraquat-inducible protein A [Telmatospirillum sp.]|uniref:paraquat-inducible protein A n=1 Tax=Telmatospirillum sp. TaxID=2079197 RepID=UPI002844C052|nr:paraquat-inducible protein A [Telmatospirillum sp.]MDR3435534.1 paraquat-inducible protein A [Telmatospirillum sp.]